MHREKEIEKENKIFEEEGKKRKQLLEELKEEQKKEEEKIEKEIERIDLAYISKLEKKEKFKEDVKKEIGNSLLGIIKQTEEMKRKEKLEKYNKLNRNKNCRYYKRK